MEKQPTIKILVGYHKPATLLKSDILVPIHVGRAVAREASKDGVLSEWDYQWMVDNMIGDNTGENISHLNREYCELTALYWAWKNYDQLGNPDYIGFMHYRRHLIFNTKETFREASNGMVYVQNIDKAYVERYHLKSEYIRETVKGNEVIICSRVDLRKLGTNSPYLHYKKGGTRGGLLHIEDYDQALNVIREKYPDFSEDIVKYNDGHYAYFTNVFIMCKEQFYKYCEWLFDVLGACQFNLEKYDKMETRQRGYISEWLTGIYITHVRRKGVKITELQETSVLHPELSLAIHPAFEKESVNIVFSSDANYIPYLSVAIQSIIDNSSTKYNYDIIILNNDIHDWQKNFLLSMVATASNIRIRFVNMDLFVGKYNLTGLFTTKRHITFSTYLRLFIGEILANYKRVIYLDCDLVVTRDIAELFFMDINNRPVAAVLDTLISNQLLTEGLDAPFWGRFTKYMRERLSFTEVSNYFNSGVLIIDIPKFKKYGVKNLIDLAKLNNRYFHDQNVLNAAFGGNYFILPPRWNYQWHIKFLSTNYKKVLRPDVLQMYENHKIFPYIIHYTSHEKPWTNPNHSFANTWWLYARRSPFYELLLSASFLKQESVPEGVLKDALQFVKLKINYYRYKILSKVTLGKTRKHYKEKKSAYKERIRAVHRFIKVKGNS